MGKRVGKYLQQLRQNQGVSIRQLGEQVCLSPAHLSMVEKGRREVSIMVLFPIVKALNGNFECALRLLVLDAGIPEDAVASVGGHIDPQPQQSA